MVILRDPMQREWVENADANPDFVQYIKPSLVSFMAFNRGREARFAGTGFIIAGDSNGAVVVTARHVFDEGIVGIQRPENLAAGANFFSLSRYRQPSIDPRHLKAQWVGGRSGEMLDVIYAEYFDDIDICVCVVRPQSDHVSQFVPATVPLFLEAPTIGAEVVVVAYRFLVINELVAPQEAGGRGQVIQTETSVSMRLGTITGVYLSGYRQYRWPCFTTSVPAEPGMSGGFAYLPASGETISACGIVSADNSTMEARASFAIAGESVMTMSWPALALRLPDVMPPQADTQMRSLLERMLDGNLPSAIGDLGRMRIEQLAAGQRRISFV